MDDPQNLPLDEGTNSRSNSFEVERSDTNLRLLQRPTEPTTNSKSKLFKEVINGSIKELI